MNTSIAILVLFVIRLAIPVVALFIIGEWLSKLEDVSAFPRNNGISDDADYNFEKVLQ